MALKDHIDPDAPKKPKRKWKVTPYVEKPARDILFTKRQVDLIALRATGMTLQAAGEAVGYPPAHAASEASRAISSAKKKLSRNEQLQEHLNLRGATLERVSEVLFEAMSATTPVVVRDSKYEKDEVTGKMQKVNIARIENVPDHRVRVEAAKYTTAIHQAEPEKKVITEVRTFESKVSVIAEIRQNPIESIAMIQAMLEQKSSQ